VDNSLTSKFALTASTLQVGDSTRARVAHLLDKLIFGGLLALLILTPVPYGSAEPWWEAMFECAVFALMVLHIIGSVLDESWRLHTLSLAAPLLAIIAFAFLQIHSFGVLQWASKKQDAGWNVISDDPASTRFFIFRLSALIITGELLLRYTTNRRRLWLLVHTIIGVGVASALFGIVRQMAQNDAGFVLPALIGGEGYGQFINANHFAFLMEMVLGLILGLIFWGSLNRRHLPIYAVAAFIVWVALVLSKSRGGILGMLSQLLFLGVLLSSTRLYWRQSNTKGENIGVVRMAASAATRIMLITSLLVMVCVGALWIGGDPLANRLVKVSTEVESGQMVNRENTRRIDIWRATWALIKSNKFVGVGFGGYAVAISRYHDASGEFSPQQAHNDYLELLASGGIFGVALGVWFVMASVVQARRALRGQEAFRRSVCFGALAGLFAVAVHSLVDFGLHIIANALIFTAVVVLATANEQTAEHFVWAKSLRRKRTS